MDMIVFPILWSLLQTMTHSPITQWNPLTLQGAGLFHIAMGAVLGIAAFGRTQEKMAGANNGGAQTTTGFTAGTPAFGQPAAGGFGASGTSFTPAPSWGTTPIPGSGNSNTGFGTAAATTDTPTVGTAAPVGASGRPVGPAQSFPSI
jgi:hypothetical protein